MHQKEFNPDGTLKEETRSQLVEKGLSSAAIARYEAVHQAEYDEWKHLDETNPEPWPVYTAWDVWFTAKEKKQFNPDGSLKPSYVQEALSQGMSVTWLMEKERKKKNEVESYNRLSASYAERGINFGKCEMESRQTTIREYNQTRKMQQQDRRNFEEISSLPMDVEPDEYF
jgi:hypothetical protein